MYGRSGCGDDIFAIWRVRQIPHSDSQPGFLGRDVSEGREKGVGVGSVEDECIFHMESKEFGQVGEQLRKVRMDRYRSG